MRKLTYLRTKREKLRNSAPRRKPTRRLLRKRPSDRGWRRFSRRRREKRGRLRKDAVKPKRCLPKCPSKTPRRAEKLNLKLPPSSLLLSKNLLRNPNQKLQLNKRQKPLQIRSQKLLLQNQNKKLPLSQSQLEKKIRKAEQIQNLWLKNLQQRHRDQRQLLTGQRPTERSRLEARSAHSASSGSLTRETAFLVSGSSRSSQSMVSSIAARSSL